MASPVGITLNNNFSIIIELTDDVINQINVPNISGAYVRQIGALVNSCDVDDFIQYRTDTQFAFQQSGTTFAMIDNSDVLFVQEPLP
jgi:hypothetical protein